LLLFHLINKTQAYQGNTDYKLANSPIPQWKFLASGAVFDQFHHYSAQGPMEKAINSGISLKSS
jgi:hypothetical protein